MPSRGGSPYGSQYGSRASSPRPALARAQRHVALCLENRRLYAIVAQVECSAATASSPIKIARARIIFDFIDTDKSGQVSKADASSLVAARL